MFKKLFLLNLFCFFLTWSVFSQGEKSGKPTEKKSNSEILPIPKSAKTILDAALNNAKTSDKNVFLIFHASWCGWCKKLDQALESKELKPIFEKYFVITHLDVLEAKDKSKELENPGGKDILDKFGGSKSGLPFFVFLDKEEKMIANSNVMPKDQNLGYPGSPEEIQEFEKLVKKSAKNISDKEVSTIVEYLLKNSPTLNTPPKKDAKSIPATKTIPVK